MKYSPATLDFWVWAAVIVALFGAAYFSVERAGMTIEQAAEPRREAIERH